MSKNEIHIIFSSDDAYVQHLGVLLISLFENNQEEVIIVHLLSDNISILNRELLYCIVEKRYKQKLIFYEIDKKYFKDFPLRLKDHISVAAYFRLKLADFLPKELARVLYMDCDMVVTGKIRSLWEIDFNGYAIAAVMDTLSYLDETYERLSLPCGDKYFNSGLLLINLDYWRHINVYSEALKVAEAKAEVLLWHDQDILNILFHSHWLHLPYRWNVMNTLMRPLSFYTFNEIKMIDHEIRNRRIVHYSCAWKPWIYPCDNPLRFEYFKYLSLSPWRDFKPEVTIWKRVRWCIHNIRLTVGNLKQPYRSIEI